MSIKTVRQSDGTDMDPSNITIEQDHLRKRNINYAEQPKLTLDAVLNTVCSKCGTRGHFAKECFSSDKKYDVLPEVSDEDIYQAELRKTVSMCNVPN